MSHVDLAVLPDPPRVSTPDAPFSPRKIRYGSEHGPRVEPYRYSRPFTTATGQQAQLAYSADASHDETNISDIIRDLLNALEETPVWRYMKLQMARLKQRAEREAEEKRRQQAAAEPMPAPAAAQARDPSEAQRAKYSREAAAAALANKTPFEDELGRLIGFTNAKRIGMIKHPARPLASASLCSELERRQRYAKGQEQTPWHYQKRQHTREQVDAAVRLATKKGISFDRALQEVA